MSAALKLEVPHVSCHVGAGNHNQVPWQGQVLLTTEHLSSLSITSQVEYTCVLNVQPTLAVSLLCLYLDSESICPKILGSGQEDRLII